MIGRNVNLETGDHTKPVEHVVTVSLGAVTHTFSVWCNRYVETKLTRDDWQQCLDKTQATITGAVRLLLSKGVMPSTHRQELANRAEHVMKHLIYKAFRIRQEKAGNTEWQVDSLLNGKEYRV